MQPQAQKTRVLAVIDDCEFVRCAWELLLGSAVVTAAVAVRLFADPAEFWAAYHGDPEFLAGLSWVICDLYFENSEVNGFETAAELRRRHAGKVYLSSSAAMTPAAAGLFDGVLAKDPAVWAEFCQRLLGETPGS